MFLPSEGCLRGAYEVESRWESMAFCRSDIRASPPPPRRGWMAPPRRVLAALLLGAAAPAAAFQPARVSSQHRHSVAVCSTIDNRRRRSRSDNEASEGLGIVNVPVTEDAIKMAKDKLDGRPGSVASAATASAVAAAAAASDALPDVGGFDPWSPFS